MATKKPTVGSVVEIHQNNTPTAVAVVTGVNDDGSVNVAVLTATNNNLPVGQPDSSPDNPDPLYVFAGDEVADPATDGSSSSGTTSTNL